MITNFNYCLKNLKMFYWNIQNACVFVFEFVFCILCFHFKQLLIIRQHMFCSSPLCRVTFQLLQVLINNSTSDRMLQQLILIRYAVSTHNANIIKAVAKRAQQPKVEINLIITCLLYGDNKKLNAKLRYIKSELNLLPIDRPTDLYRIVHPWIWLLLVSAIYNSDVMQIAVSIALIKYFVGQRRAHCIN